MKNLIFGAILCLSFSINAYGYPEVPDPDMTPGTLCSLKNKDFETHRYEQKIPYCRRNVSRRLKTQIYLEYEVDLKCRSHYTVDHYIPLSIGGDNSQTNLWPEHKLVKKLRQNLEMEVYEAVRDGELTQKEAVDIIVDAKLNPPFGKKPPKDPCQRNIVYKF